MIQEIIKDFQMNIDTIKEMYDFTGKTVVITGGAGVLCKEMVSALLGCNANVVVIDRDLDLAEKMLTNLNYPKAKAIALFADVLKSATLQKACDTVIEKFGTIDFQDHPLNYK